jgi:hypothetical protein
VFTLPKVRLEHAAGINHHFIHKFHISQYLLLPPPPRIKMIQGRERWYFAAVSLNNSAILLAERGQYRRALSVIQDSMFAIREATLDPCKSSDIDIREMKSTCMHGSLGRRSGRQGSLAAEGMLNRASRFVMDLDVPSAEIPSVPPRIEIESQVLDVDVPNLETKRGTFPDATLRLLRIDDPACHDAADSSPVGYNLASISIVNNYAVIALLHPLAEQGLRIRAAHVAHRAFHFACSLLVGKHASKGGPVAAFAALQLTVMVAQCTYQLHVELGDCWAAWTSLNHYQFVNRALQDEEEKMLVRRPNDPFGWLSVTHAKAA